MNGNTATQLALEPAPMQPQAQDELDPATLRRIGEITADGVLLLATGMREFSADGAMAGHTRELGGELFVRLYQLQQATMTDDFARLMHTHGKAVLWQRNPEIFRTLPGTKIDRAVFDRGIDVLVGHLCAVLKHVTESERIHQLAMAN